VAIPKLQEAESQQCSVAEANSTRPLRSVGAVLLGLVAVNVLSLATDQVFHALKIYPAWGQPMYDPRLNLLALAYRIPYEVLGSYIAARFAPRRPMLHALILGFIGFGLSLVGGIVAMRVHLGPNWFPISLIITALPCAWLGGALYTWSTPSK